MLWVVIAVILMFVFNNFGAQGERGNDAALSYSQFIDVVKAGQVQQVTIDEHIVKGKLQSGQLFKTYAPTDGHMIDDLLANGVDIKAVPPEQPSMLMQLLVSFGPMLLLIAVWVFFMRQMQGGGAGWPGCNELWQEQGQDVGRRPDQGHFCRRRRL